MVINGGRTKPKEIAADNGIVSKNGGKVLKVKAVNWPAYGVDVLRMWVASTDFTHDVVIGPTNIKKVSESLRKIRNTARFILGNLDSGESSDLDSRMKQWSDASIDLDRLSPLNKLMIYRLEAFV